MSGVPTLRPFDFHGVRLEPSRWQQQVAEARDFYLGIDDDDILHGFRRAAGLPAPGRPLGGWCGEDSSMVFGQWLSGLSRLSQVLGDELLRTKVLGLHDAWAVTIGPDGDARMPHYTFDKLVGGLVDVARYAGHRAAIDSLERVVTHAMATFDDSNDPPRPASTYQGVPMEWYTLTENLVRAAEESGDARYLDHAARWRHDGYWSKFDDTDSPVDAHGGHAYSHVNTFASALAAAAAWDEPALVRQAANAGRYIRRHQAYATGGYGPNERIVALDGSLGRALDTRTDTCEVPCCTWAVFKLAGGLLERTGEATWGDWIEQLFYNAIGAALPLAEGGRNFYYGDYRVGGGIKVHNWERFTCCSGTYAQNMAEYHRLIWFRSDDGLAVNLYVPSTVNWSIGGRSVTVKQATSYPDDGAVSLTVSVDAPVDFALRLRVPAWSGGIAVAVNGAPVAAGLAGGWAIVERRWSDGDRVEVSVPLPVRMVPVDDFHPDRVAVMRGPVVMVFEGTYHDPALRLPADDATLQTWLEPERGGTPRGIHGQYFEPDDPPLVYRLAPPDGPPVRLRLRPFYDIGPDYPYFMYVDRDALPYPLW